MDSEFWLIWSDITANPPMEVYGAVINSLGHHMITLDHHKIESNGNWIVSNIISGCIPKYNDKPNNGYNKWNSLMVKSWYTVSIWFDQAPYDILCTVQIKYTGYNILTIDIANSTRGFIVTLLMYISISAIKLRVPGKLILDRVNYNKQVVKIGIIMTIPL